eukprot:scaffold3028_cov109-Skeletonema_marinoi.AAC.6
MKEGALQERELERHELPTCIISFSAGSKEEEKETHTPKHEVVCVCRATWLLTADHGVSIEDDVTCESRLSSQFATT